MHLNMSSNSINFGSLNVSEKCNNLIQVAPENTDESSHHTYHAQKRDADTEYFSRFKMALSSHVGGINFADPDNIRKKQQQTNETIKNQAYIY